MKCMERNDVHSMVGCIRYHKVNNERHRTNHGQLLLKTTIAVILIQDFVIYQDHDQDQDHNLEINETNDQILLQ